MHLISGASGFIAGRLARSMDEAGLQCRLLYRHLPTQPPESHQIVQGDLSDPSSLQAACAGVDTVFHCAGYAHAFADSDPERHWRVNAEGTRHLVEAAGRAGVRCFVYLSSVKAMAEPGKTCVDEDHPGLPSSDYGRAKCAAEKFVREAGDRYGMRIVNLRLTMVYGSGGRGNLERMARLVQRGWFPPLPETGNRRSLVHVDDVVSAMRCVADHPQSAGNVYIVTGPDQPSGRALYDALRQVLGLPRKTWAVPAAWLHGIGRVSDMLGGAIKRRFPLNSEVVERLLGSACYDGGRIERDLGWVPNIGLNEGLKEMLSVSETSV